jgi:cell division protein FtsQ
VLRREWPDSVLITVTERNPVAKFGVGTHLFGVVDETGRLLEISSAPPSGLVPLRIPNTAVVPGDSLPRADAVLARVASAVPESILHEIRTLEGTSTGAVVVLRSGARAELGQATDLAAKMTALATMLGTPSVVLGAHSSIDLRVPDAPVVTSS